MARYPENLPGPTIEFNYETQQPFITTQFVSGGFRTRRTYSSVPTTVEARFNFDDGELRLFESWFRSINDGADWFDMELTLPVGTGLWQCKFTEMYSPPRPFGTANRWTTGATFRLKERPSWDGDAYNNWPDVVQYGDALDVANNTYGDA